MFDIPDEKIFMDSIHGYINVPRCFVRHLIDTEVFQRLRNIDQTGMRTLYPNARHDRFSHSLGAFHLGCKAVDALLENFSHDDYWHIRSDKTQDIFWAKNKVLFLIACLLHDIGHVPFSHALEQIVLENSTNNGVFTQNLQERLLDDEDWGEPNSGVLKAAAHEKSGAMYILEHMSENIERVFDELIEKRYPSTYSEHLLYAEHYHDDVYIDKEDLKRDICFIARMILGYKYVGYTPEKQIRNCFIELLNGSSFDVDKLDYVIRDTRESGISNTNVDVERLLDSLSIITKTRYVGKTLGNPAENLCKNLCDSVVLQMSAGADDFLSIAGNFRGTILLKSDTAVTIRSKSTFLSLSPIDHAQICYGEDAQMASFGADTTIVQDGDVINTRRDKKTLELKNGKPFECTITNATLLEEDFTFRVHHTDAPGAAIKLEVYGSCDISISGAFKISSPFNCFDVRACGHIQEAVLLGNLISRQVPDPKRYNEFSVGFKKKAINVIANVLKARNYLYLWIYSHHKVMYYANFLIPVLSREVLRTSCLDRFPKWKLDYEHIGYLDDSYVWTAIKYYYDENKGTTSPLIVLCQEFFSRRYKISLCKSLAEVDVLFSALLNSEKIIFKKHLSEHCRMDFPYLGTDSISAGYLTTDILDALKELGASEQIKDVIYLDASFKVGKSNADETFIVMKNEVIPLSAVSLLSKQDLDTDNTEHYFYLYYSTDTTDSEKLEYEAQSLKDAIRKYAEKIIGDEIKAKPHFT